MWAATAQAQAPGSGPGGQRTLTTPRTYSEPPAGWTRSGSAAIAIARREPRVAEHARRYVRAFQAGDRRWQVSFYEGRGGEERAQVLIDDRDGTVLEAWTGPQVAWTMARGYDGAFGRKASAAYVWIPLCLAFLLPFAARRPRLIHLDLLVLLSFGISYWRFGQADLDWSVPLAYPPLVYLLARAVWIARRGPPSARTWMSADLLGVAIVFLIGFRVGLNITSSNVIDVGYSGVIGADRIAHGEALYGNFPSDNEHGDTYGPVTYLAYLPFELVAPWTGRWDSLPAAHAAAVTFDLATAALLFLLGRRLDGSRTGALLAFLWLAFPFSLLVANSGANDALVGALVLATLLAHARPAARGALAALAGLTKFAPLGLVPLLARGSPLRFGAAFGLTAVAVTVPAVWGGGLDSLLDRTLGFQDGRDSPFSVWGLYDLGWAGEIVQWAAVAFALSLGFVRRPPGVAVTAALAAAVLIAFQLAVTHWFYLYLAWFVPPLLVALLVPQGAGRSTGSIDSARPGSPQRIRTPISQGSSSAAS